MNRLTNNIKIGLFFLLQCVSGTLANAQQAGGIFHYLTTKNGLSSNQVNKVIQDREGFYWIATGDGLNRFDGSTCKIFRNIKNDSTSLSSNNCLNLLEDNMGDIWITTPRGVNRYVTSEGKFERHYLSHPTLSFAQVNAISGIAKDEKGNIWIASAGLWQYNIYTRQWMRYLNDPNERSSIPAGIYPAVQYDKFNKGLWMSNSSLIFFDIATSRFYHAHYNPKNLTVFKITPADDYLAIDSAGAIWFYRYPGGVLCKYSLNNNIVRFFPVSHHSGGLRNISVDAQNRLWFSHWTNNTRIFDPAISKMDTSFLAYFHPQSALTPITTQLYVDRTGIYWISSAKGISIYDPHAQAVKYFLLNDSRKPDDGLDNVITCLAEQNDNIIWVGTRAALFRYDLLLKKGRAIENLPLSSTPIRCLYLQNDSVLWIGGWDELLLFDLRKEKTIKKISLKANPQFITASNEGQIWIGTWKRGLFKYSSSGQLTDHLVYEPGDSGSIRYNGLTCFSNSSKEPCLWIGYNYQNGFFKVNYNNHAIENFKIPAPSPFSNVSNSVNSIAEDGHGNLWLGTSGGGLVYFDRQKNSFTTYTQSDGMKGDYINKILQDAHSNIWVTTSNGLSIIDARTKSIINSEIDLAFDNNDLVANGIIRKNKKLLFFSGRKMVEIDPGLFLQPAYPSKILLSNFKIFEKETSITKDTAGKQRIDLSYQQNFFSFEYSLLKPNPAATTQYSYKLENFDKDWNYVKERRTAFYTNVPPGNYEFRVKANDASGQWIYFSDPVTITIPPPFWRTWWFYTLCSIAAAGLCYVYYNMRIKRILEMQSIRNKISRDLHDDIGSTLSTIKILSGAAEKKITTDAFQSGQMLHKITESADKMMDAMSDIVWSINPANDRVENMTVRMREYAAKALEPKDIQYKVIADDKSIGIKLPIEKRKDIFLIFKEAVNNLAKYAEATEVAIFFDIHNDFAELKIQDNGKGFDVTKLNTGNGLKNMKQRAKNIEGSLTILSKEGEGASIHLIVPIT